LIKNKPKQPTNMDNALYSAARLRKHMVDAAAADMKRGMLVRWSDC